MENNKVIIKLDDKEHLIELKKIYDSNILYLDGMPIKGGATSFEMLLLANDLIIRINTPELQYQTYEEAMEATHRLGVSNYIEYLELFHKDPKLPMVPELVYSEFKKRGVWSRYLGVKVSKYYSTVKESQDAMSKLGILKNKEFETYNKRDPMLHSSGWEHFKIPSRDFLKTSVSYPSFEEAKAAIKHIASPTLNTYSRIYKSGQDPRLPYKPEVVYKDFKSKGGLLGLLSSDGIYETYQEASNATKNLDIKSGHEYSVKKAYLQDQRLPSNPHVLYPEFYKHGNDGWTTYLQVPPITKPIRYATFELALEAIKALGITSNRSYMAIYKNDPMLPSNIYTYYGKGNPSPFPEK
jgi:hypothetical protein